MRSIRSTPIGGRPLPGWDRTARSVRTAPATEPLAPSQPEIPPAASSCRNVQTPPSPASAASLPQPTRDNPPRGSLYHDHWEMAFAEVPLDGPLGAPYVSGSFSWHGGIIQTGPRPSAALAPGSRDVPTPKRSLRSAAARHGREAACEVSA